MRTPLARIPGPRGTSLAALAALGVVFGDIGTSPLYALSAAFTGAGGTDRITILGITSMVVWTVTAIVTVLYVQILMRHDNDGEGGLLALLTLIRRTHPGPIVAAMAAIVAMIGAGMFLGDGVITPAISVLSAVEGVTVSHPGLARYVVGATAIILVGLFVAQRAGTGRIGVIFGPIMLAWFAASAAFGLVSILSTPEALSALSPHWIVLFVWHRPGAAFVALSSVILTVTGAEALYADMGHFGRRPITTAWAAIVFPALLIGYLGQAAAVLRDPTNAARPFYASVPTWATIPMVVLATVATVIASQAVISGTFSVVQQAGRLGLLPRLRTIHTSASARGQIYLPTVNLVLAACVVALVFTFRSSAALASAYGVAVTVTMGVTATLLIVLLAARGHLRTVSGAATTAMLAVVAVFIAANLLKIPTGGWLPLAIGAIVFAIMRTWDAGERHLADIRRIEQPMLGEALEELRRARLTPGVTVYLTHDLEIAPGSLSTILEHYGVATSEIVLVQVHTRNVPRGRTIRVSDVMPGVRAVGLGFGYREPADVASVLTSSAAGDVGLDPAAMAQAWYALTRDTLVPSREAPMPIFVQRAYIVMKNLGVSRAVSFRLPPRRTTITGRELYL